MPQLSAGKQTARLKPIPSIRFRRSPNTFSSLRLQGVLGIVGFGFLLLSGRLFTLHVLQHEKWVDIANKQHEFNLTLAPERGMILDRSGKPFATSKLVPSVYAVPYNVLDPAKTATKLSSLLSADARELEVLLKREKSFVWLKRLVSDETSEQLQDLKIPGIGLRYENKRFYPQGELLAPVIGFCNIDEQGLEGIELSCNRFLSGRSGYRRTKRDALGREIAAFDEQLVPPVNGHDVHLTIDQFIQFQTEQALKQAVEKWRAKGGMAMVTNPQTGEVLAMASLPTFDPNQYKEEKPDQRRNRTITDYLEPGSTFKFITASAALEQKAFNFESKIDCEQGAYKVSTHILHDVKPNGLLSFPQVFIKSSNIGTVKIAQALGPEILYRQMKKFGMGELTGIDLPGETEGILRPLKDWSKLSISALPIGHEVGVTVIQMVRAFSAIANGGNLMRPYIVREIRDRQGNTIQEQSPVVDRQILKLEIAQQMTEILTRAVEEGTGKNARIPGMAVAGKTGTAQKLTDDGKTYSHDKYVSLFIGFAPSDAPRFTMMVVIDEPQGQYYGGTVAAPVFKQVMEKVLLQEGLLKKDPNILKTSARK